VTPSAVSLANVVVDLGVVFVQAVLYSVIAYYLGGMQHQVRSLLRSSKWVFENLFSIRANSWFSIAWALFHLYFIHLHDLHLYDSTIPLPGGNFAPL